MSDKSAENVTSFWPRSALAARLAALLCILLLAGCANLGTREKTTGVYQRGEAAYYAASFDGRRTASGERYDSDALTAAHRSLALGTQVRVTNLDNGRQVTVRINDRGPFTRGRIIDLSHRAAERLHMIGSGVAPVALEVVGN